MNMRIAVCDSDIEICRDIRNMILNQRPESKVKVFLSSEELLREEMDFQIYFLDIKGVSGMELAHKIREKEGDNGGGRSILIFVTGYREYMEEAFDVHAFHYLLKPIHPDKFGQVLERAWQEAEYKENQKDDAILLKISNRKLRVFLRDIYYVESNNKKVSVHTNDGVYDVQGKMDEFETLFGPSFYRCHRCYLVNFAKVSSYNQNEIIIENGDSIMLAYKKYSAFVKAYLSYAKGGGIVNV